MPEERGRGGARTACRAEDINRRPRMVLEILPAQADGIYYICMEYVQGQPPRGEIQGRKAAGPA